MSIRHFRSFIGVLASILIVACFIAASAVSTLLAQGAKQAVPETAIAGSDADHVKERDAWFFRGRVVAGKPSAELRRRAYQTKLRMRAQHAAALAGAGGTSNSSASSGSWLPLGPVPLASDATGNGTQDYHQVAGRATAVAIDPADTSGNTVYIGGAQSGVWKSTNAAGTLAGNVTWTPLTDDAATLSVGALAIQPGNTTPAQTVILAATGEADNSSDSYFGLGILRSADAGNTWTLTSTANGGALSFSGLGGTRMAFSTASGQTSTAVSAMATSSEGLVAGAVTANTMPGLYTSLDAGQTWTYDALTDPGGATDATSATSVFYNAIAGEFFAAVRYHGFYSSPDGVNWTRLSAQPGGGLLGTAVCPPQSTSNNYACPIYRAEIAVVPGRNEMYAWFVYFSASGVVDGGIWQSLNGGASWNSISDASIDSCGDPEGCGVEQGSYDLALLAIPNASATDLYAGAVNLYKCSISSQNPTCSSSPFINLTHVYGCDPIAAPAHVHPDQHALAYATPTSGVDSGNDLMYFANDGGIYRALDGVGGLTTGSCSGTNQFDDLNQNLGSMTQFVSFSQHPTDPNTLLGGTQDNGSPATGQLTTNPGWDNVLGGDGGYNAIDPNATTNLYASNPDIPPGGLSVQLCTSGVNCVDSRFDSVVASNDVGGDDGAFYFPYILDSQSSTALLVGTCRVWRGARAGGAYTALSPNFDTLGSGTCSGSEVNLVRALAAGGPTDPNGSTVIYATTSGLGPTNGPLETPAGGRVWVTISPSAGTSSFTDVTGNGPAGNINPNQFPVSGVAIDASDPSGDRAYVTVMGFTEGPGHVWKTTNAGASWTDYTANLPDSPVNAVVIDPVLGQVYVGTDVGVFASSTSSPNWTEVGPTPGANRTGFLPDVAVTALAIFSSGGEKLLRASTYGRGIWQWNLVPDFSIAISNSPQTILTTQTATFNGTASAFNGYTYSIVLSCVAGATSPPAICNPTPAVAAGGSTPFTVTASGSLGDYEFNIQGVGSDPTHITHNTSVVLHITTPAPDFVLDEVGTFPTVNAGSTNASGSVSVSAIHGFNGVVSLTCSLTSGNGSCSMNPTPLGSFPATSNVTVNAANLSAGSYQLNVQGTSTSSTHTLPILFNVADYQVSGMKSVTAAPGAQGTAALTITPSTFYVGNIDASCDASSLPGANCTLSPASPLAVRDGAAVPFTATISVPGSAAAGNYNIDVNTHDATGEPIHNFVIALTVSTANQDFRVTSSTSSQTVVAGQTTGAYQLTVAPNPTGSSFASAVTLTCSGLPSGATCLFSPSAPVAPGTSAAAVTMTVSTGATTPTGTSTVTVTGTSGTISHSTTVSLTVTAPNSLQLAISKGFPATVDAGSQTVAKLTATANYSGSLTVTCDTSSFSGQCVVTSPIAVSANVAAPISLTVNVPNNAAPNGTNAYKVDVTVADASGTPSQKIALPLTVIQDFSVSSSTPSQTVNPGQTTGPYNLTIAPNPTGSSFQGTVTLSCPHGLPSGAQCLFNPSAPVAPPFPQTVVLTISTTAPTSASSSPGGNGSIFYGLWLMLPGIALAVSGRRSKRKSILRTGALRTWALFSAFLLLALLPSCSGVSSGGGGGGGGTPAGTYTITVTGASSVAPAAAGQTTKVILVVN